MPTAVESRGFSRCPLTARAELRLSSGVLVEGETRNVSLNGILFATERSLPVGHDVKITLILQGPDGCYRIQSEGYVSRVADDGVGVAFERVRKESLDSLHRLLNVPGGVD